MRQYRKICCQRSNEVKKPRRKVQPNTIYQFHDDIHHCDVNGIAFVGFKNGVMRVIFMDSMQF